MDNNSPLFLAHQKDRNADCHLKLGRFDEAVACHERASELLQQAMTLTKYAKALESLQLQKDYHLKQTDLIRARKLQTEIRKQVIDLKKRKRMEKRQLTPIEHKDQKLQWAILKTMEEADSLLCMLRERTSADDDRTLPETVSESPTSSSGFKHPKDEKVVMEELRTVNAQLRSLVAELLSQLDASRREVESLRARLKLYEDTSVRELAPLEMPNFDYSSI